MQGVLTKRMETIIVNMTQITFSKSFLKTSEDKMQNVSWMIVQLRKPSTVEPKLFFKRVMKVDVIN